MGVMGDTTARRLRSRSAVGVGSHTDPVGGGGLDSGDTMDESAGQLSDGDPGIRETVPIGV
jgi:hypothetical protein